MSVYYNEIDPYCAAWLQNLMDAGQIPHGVIDTRSIQDVRPDELTGYVQCHFFAGIGGWPLALALAGWPSDRPVWTGSCPCQPFSAAGKGAGFADERHLWPAWQHLVAQRRPPIIFGEQVASKDADAWIDLVHADMEGLDYTFGCVPFPSAGVGAPHIRDRNYWVADTLGSGFQGPSWSCDAQEQRTSERGVLGRMANADRDGCGTRGSSATTAGHGRSARAASGNDRHEHARAHHGGWDVADWLRCRDGKWRPVEPGTFPLAHGLPGRVGRLRAYGNAINPWQAAEFIRSFLDVEDAQSVA